MIRYHHPPGVFVQKVGNRPVLTTPQEGRVVVDSILLELWQRADARFLAEIIEHGHIFPEAVIYALACLAEAGLLERETDDGGDLDQIDSPITGNDLVSVVLVGYNSRKWLKECIPSLLAQTYQHLEIIIVDNGSQDATLDWVNKNYPQIHAIGIRNTISLAAAINNGVELASGEFFLLLNPDVRLEPDAIAQMVRCFDADPKIGAVAAKLKFLWAPSFLNGLGNRVGSFSWGTDNALGHLDLGQYDDWEELSSACFAATLISRKAWENVGSLDAGFPMYYEDLEWCYRARLLGYKIWAAPHAIVYHAFGGRIPNGESADLSPSKLKNVVYGRYRFVSKILDDYFARFIRNYLLEDIIHFFRRIIFGKWALAQAYLQAWKAVIAQRNSLRELRKEIQTRRILKSDTELFGLETDIPVPHIWNGMPELTWDLIENYYIPLMKTGKIRAMPELELQNQAPRLLIVSHEVVNKKMAGPGMRYLEMALALKSHLDVTLAIPAKTDLKISNPRIVCYDEKRSNSLKKLVEGNDIALISGYMVEKNPFLETTKTRLVVDLYDPMTLENLHYNLHEDMSVREALSKRAVDIMNRLVQVGDFFICGNERQRDYWLGVLTANGRVNPQTFQQDSELKALIDVVGIGFPSRKPKHTQRIVRGKHPLVPDDARIVLWGGGIWNWLDPLSLVKAWPLVIERYPEARLVFLGTRHPNPSAPVHDMVLKTISLAEEIGEKDRTILFYDWIDYDSRESLLLEADVGVVLHPVHIETRYSARTRILDYFWARLPVLVTEGDVTSEWVREFDLGRVAPEADPAGIAAALIQIFDKPKEAYEDAFADLASQFSWPIVVQPLLQYCLIGNFAPDRYERSGNKTNSRGLVIDKSFWIRAKFIWRTEGNKALLRRIGRYIQWRLSIP